MLLSIANKYISHCYYSFIVCYLTYDLISLSDETVINIITIIFYHSISIDWLFDNWFNYSGMVIDGSNVFLFWMRDHLCLFVRFVSLSSDFFVAGRVGFSNDLGVVTGCYIHYRSDSMPKRSMGITWTRKYCSTGLFAVCFTCSNNCSLQICIV